MKNAVWKFVLAGVGIHQDSVIGLPPDAKIVEFGFQVHPTTGEEGWFLWAVVDPDQKFVVERKFVVVATGANWATKDLDHVMTAKDPSGYVWHLLEWRRA
jgi:hypothetical protein